MKGGRDGEREGEGKEELRRETGRKEGGGREGGRREEEGREEGGKGEGMEGKQREGGTEGQEAITITPLMKLLVLNNAIPECSTGMVITCTDICCYNKV